MSVTAEHVARPARNHWYAAVFLLLAAFINLLDATIVNLALPAIRRDLDASTSALQWVLVVYVLTFAAGLLPFGRFGDVFGRRRMFVSGLSGFIVASVACGLAPGVQALIAARAIQGLAGAMMVPQVLAIIHATFPPEDKGRAIGLFGTVSGLGAVAGPLIGGILVSADLFGLGWRPVFLINLPLGLVALAGAIIFLPRVSERRPGAVDWTGSVLFAGATAALIFPLIEGRPLGWPLWLIALFALSVMLGLAFLRRQHDLAARGATQTLPLTLLRDRRFLAGIGFVTLLFSGIAGTIVILAIFLQSGLGFSPARAGLALAAHPLSAMLAAWLTGRLGTRFLGTRVFAGVLSLAVGMIWLQFSAADAGPGLELQALWLPLALIGAGIGSSTVAMFQSVLASVATSDAGAGSGMLQAFQQIGIAIGIALVGQIFFSVLGDAAVPAAYGHAMTAALWLPVGTYALLCLAALPGILQRKDNT